ncbi:hypothetical protein ACA910_004971 [Epithemia clementina (nom. ined.)]
MWRFSIASRTATGNCSSNSSDSKSTTLAILAAVGGTVTVVLLYNVWELVQEHGVQGALYYIWEGDPYPPDIRPYMHRLQSLSDRLKQERQSIQALQRALERARQQSSDLTTTKKNEYNNNTTVVEADQDCTALITLWTQYFEDEQSLDDDATTSMSMATTSKNNKVDLKLTLGGLSHKLDQLAAQIDAVPSSSAGAAIVKQLKKELSTEIVTLMEQADALISFYQQKTTVTTTTTTTTTTTESQIGNQ